jgi:hypothetical protein
LASCGGALGRGVEHVIFHPPSNTSQLILINQHSLPILLIFIWWIVPILLLNLSLILNILVLLKMLLSLLID